MSKILMPDETVTYMFTKEDAHWNSLIATNYEMEIEANWYERFFASGKSLADNLLFGMGDTTIRLEGRLLDVQETISKRGKCFQVNLNLKEDATAHILIGPNCIPNLLWSYKLEQVRELKDKVVYLHKLPDNQNFGISPPPFIWARLSDCGIQSFANDRCSCRCHDDDDETGGMYPC